MRVLRSFIICSLSAGLSCGLATAKGLEELAKDKPEEAVEKATDANDDDETPAKGDAETPTKPVTPAKADQEAPKVQSALSKSLSDKLFVSTSFGWASARRSAGKWKGSGASDLTVGYKLDLKIMPKVALWGTYRYAPIAVAGELEGVSYRGIWEGHNFGALATYALNNTLNLLGSFELAYVLVYLRPLDNIESEKKAETNGVMANIGGGADWELMDKLSVGPRLHVGFGSFTVVQASGVASFKF